MEIPKEALKSAVIEGLKTVYDPEIPVNIYNLGLIYDVSVNDSGFVHILMTLTSPMCPVAEILPVEVKERALMVEGVSDAEVEMTWEPVWTMEKMSEEARLQMNIQ
jgi:FeS assembly SUF system protein